MLISVFLNMLKNGYSAPRYYSKNDLIDYGWNNNVNEHDIISGITR